MKVLFLDIETAPALGYFYGRYDLRITPDQLVQPEFILCYQAAWNDGPVFINSLRGKGKINPDSDKPLVKELAKLIAQADVVVAHNAERFDLAFISARLAIHNLKPFAPPQVVDTLKACRRYFKFESNSLDHVCRLLKLGRKFHSGGFETSIACMKGEEAAWDKLLRYGKHDVKLLRDLYYRLRPWMKDHPNHNLFEPSTNSCCPSCGSYKLRSNGWRYTKSMRYRRLLCTDCGAWSRERGSDLEKEKRAAITVS